MAARFAAHELLEVHELISAKNLCLQKGLAYLKVAQDPDLKDLLQTSIDESRQALSQLQQVFRRDIVLGGRCKTAPDFVRLAVRCSRTTMYAPRRPASPSASCLFFAASGALTYLHLPKAVR